MFILRLFIAYFSCCVNIENLLAVQNKNFNWISKRKANLPKLENIFSVNFVFNLSVQNCLNDTSDGDEDEKKSEFDLFLCVKKQMRFGEVRKKRNQFLVLCIVDGRSTQKQMKTENNNNNRSIYLWVESVFLSLLLHSMWFLDFFVCFFFNIDFEWTCGGTYLVLTVHVWCCQCCYRGQT